MNIEGPKNIVQKDADPFGLRKVDFTKRVAEKSELFSPEEAKTYIEGCDFPESADDLLLAWEIRARFGDLSNMRILDAMCGPGRLGRELLTLGSKDVEFHDGDFIMLDHARKKASEENQGKVVRTVRSDAHKIPVPDNTFDLVVCHNSTHQLIDTGKLFRVLGEFLRITKPGGSVLIADFQRGTSDNFIDALEKRCQVTKTSIIPLLIPSFMAAFSKEEFSTVLEILPNVESFQVIDARLPALTDEMKRRVDLDPVKGHVLDFSPISLRAIARKGAK